MRPRTENHEEEETAPVVPPRPAPAVHRDVHVHLRLHAVAASGRPVLPEMLRGNRYGWKCDSINPPQGQRRRRFRKGSR